MSSRCNYPPMIARGQPVLKRSNPTAAIERDATRVGWRLAAERDWCS